MGSNPGERYTDKGERPIGDLVKQLSEQTSRLVREEVALARAEMTEKGKAAGVAGGMFGAAGVLALFALGALTACFILALALVLDAWLAALIVAAVYAAIAGVLALVGKRKVQEASPPLPEETKESVQEDVQWVKERARAGRE
jgi:MFS family permease